MTRIAANVHRSEKIAKSATHCGPADRFQMTSDQ
jgi:hypothetical protein